MKFESFISFTNKGIYCIPGQFYIDPWRPVDYAVISHAHVDHARSGMKHYLCHEYTEPLLRVRVGQDISCEQVAYGQVVYINGVKVSLHPAGHIVGSAQVRMEYEGFVVVFSGDYKVQYDGISTPYEVVHCDAFITESTFGLPIYNWLTPQSYNTQMQEWVSDNQSNGKTSIFIGYALGKAQRIMKSLEGVAKMWVHSSIARLNEAIASTGIALPEYEVINFTDNYKSAKGDIVILPPALVDSNMIKKVPNGVTAICSGWMQVRGRRRWRAADAGFAISDHADWNGLIDSIKATGASEVYVTHGQTETFSKYLNEIGIKAYPVKTVFGDEEEL